MLLIILAIAAVAVWFLYWQPWLSRAEWTANDGQKFGEAESYIRVTVMFEGNPVNLLFTSRELGVAKERADKQAEEFSD